MAKRWLTEERRYWLRREYSRHSLPRTRELFNAEFGTEVTANQLRAANRNHRFGRARRSAASVFSEPEESWLQARLPHAPRREVARAFQERFGWRPNRHTLGNFALRHRLLGAPNRGQFRPGHVPPNKGRKGASPPGSEATRFRRGNVPANKRPLYAERWRQRRGGPVLEINVPETNPYTGAANRWVRKAAWAWRQARGPVPPGHVVVQLDGDPANCDPGNLDCIPRSALALLNTPWAPGYAGKEANPARVRLAQLRAALAARRGEGGPEPPPASSKGAWARIRCPPSGASPGR